MFVHKYNYEKVSLDDKYLFDNFLPLGNMDEATKGYYQKKLQPALELYFSMKMYCEKQDNENEVSDSEPFEMDFDETTKVWFQMTRPAENRVNLTIRVYENGALQLEEVIRETIHDPETVCKLLHQSGFTVLRCADRMLDDGGHGTTWFLIAQK